MNTNLGILVAAMCTLTGCTSNYAKSMDRHWHMLAFGGESSEWAKCIDSRANAYIKGEVKFAGTKIGDQPWQYAGAWFPLVLADCSVLQSSRELHRSSLGDPRLDIEAAFHHINSLAVSQAESDTIGEIELPHAQN